MKTKTFLSVLFIILLLTSSQKFLYAQSSPVLYFCEKYDDDKGEIGISDRFTTGYLTVVVKSEFAFGKKNVHIQLDHFDFSTHQFRFYKKFNYIIKPSQNYVYFSKTPENDMRFSDPGFYRVFLLGDNDEIIASGLVEIIE